MSTMTIPSLLEVGIQVKTLSIPTQWCNSSGTAPVWEEGGRGVMGCGEVEGVWGVMGCGEGEGRGGRGVTGCGEVQGVRVCEQVKEMGEGAKKEGNASISSMSRELLYISTTFTHQGLDHTRSLQAQCPHSLEHIYHSLHLQPVQQVGNSNVSTCITTSTTE